jgi:riboflavin kinase/FMN adenylyltransferase
LGRTLGYPTANLAVPAEKILPSGVYAVRARWAGRAAAAQGLCNIGTRPTLGEKKPRLTVEVHLLDFNGSLAGRTLRVELAGKIRAERRFPSLEALTRQIRRDERAGRRLLRPVKV